ncbi:MAG: hypothetical protein IKS23_05465 [Alphaproteobacteria bacterium]|nr:hypothetical protein [Alphaproteobacteria bacterium]
MNIFIKYLSHIIFACALGYFGLLAFVLEKDPMINKMIMVMIGGFWVLWIFAKSFLKIVFAVALLAVMLFAGYYVLHAEEIECKKAGREWNKTEKVCEDKKTVGEKLKNVVSDMVKSTFQKWKEDNIKVEQQDSDEEE